MVQRVWRGGECGGKGIGYSGGADQSALAVVEGLESRLESRGESVLIIRRLRSVMDPEKIKGTAEVIAGELLSQIPYPALR